MTYQGYRVVTSAQMAAIDRRASGEFGVPALRLMETAGRAVADETMRFIRERIRPADRPRIAVCCGRGNNGGDGLAAARYLKQFGAEVSVTIAAPKPDRGYGPEVLENLKRASAASLPVQDLADGAPAGELEDRLASSDVVVDALLGTGSSGEPAGAVAAMIQAIVGAGKPVVAVDIPSGLDPDTGESGAACVAAILTLTLGLPKKGLLEAKAREYVGELKVLEIGLPQELVRG